MFYFDNAATTLNKPICVAQAVYDAIVSLGNAGRGVNNASIGSLQMVSETRKLLADFFHFSNPNRVCFASNATEALNTAIMGLFEKNDHVITTAMEHNSVLRPLYLLEEKGDIELTVLSVDDFGRISYQELEDSIRSNTKAVVVGHASNLTGNVVDLTKVGEICLKHKILLVADCAQTAGIVPIDMQRMNISVLCFTGHKGLLGPQGTGGIIVADGVKIRPLKSGGTGSHSYDKMQPEVYPEHLEAGTLNVHGIAGLNAAVKYIIKEGINSIGEQEIALTKAFYEGIKDIPGIKLVGDYRNIENINFHTAIVSLNIEEYGSSEVGDELMTRFAIATRCGAHCAPLAHESLKTKNQGAVRFSFSHRNTMEEIKYAIEAVKVLATE